MKIWPAAVMFFADKISSVPTVEAKLRADWVHQVSKVFCLSFRLILATAPDGTLGSVITTTCALNLSHHDF